jgi:hypothetical protein
MTIEPFHSITSSAMASNGCGAVGPSALAVLRFIISSNLVGALPSPSLGTSIVAVQTKRSKGGVKRKVDVRFWVICQMSRLAHWRRTSTANRSTLYPSVNLTGRSGPAPASPAWRRQSGRRGFDQRLTNEAGPDAPIARAETRRIRAGARYVPRRTTRFDGPHSRPAE